jgi:hypothetical protein
VSEGLVQGLRVACDRTAVYLRVDGRELARRTAANELRLVLINRSDLPSRLELADPIRWAAADVLEVAIPIALLGAQAGDRVRLSVLVVDAAGQTLERQPSQHPLDFVLPTRHLSGTRWTV